MLEITRSSRDCATIPFTGFPVKRAGRSHYGTPRRLCAADRVAGGSDLFPHPTPFKVPPHAAPEFRYIARAPHEGAGRGADVDDFASAATPTHENPRRMR
ncbi:MAG TPA: hypothetical protein VHD62_16730 [Opitutaceae bacterium]|nr:hypothetical protein [Opitutaceae bacterium]